MELLTKLIIHNMSKAIRTYADAKGLVGKRALFEFKHRPQGSVKVQVRIMDFKNSWGQNRFLIEPVAGQGQIWVENLQMAS